MDWVKLQRADPNLSVIIKLIESDQLFKRKLYRKDFSEVKALLRIRKSFKLSKDILYRKSYTDNSSSKKVLWQLDNSGRPDDLTWNADIPYFKITNDSTMACKTPVAVSMPVVAPAGDAVLSSPESPWKKKLCVCESIAERPLQSASTVIMKPDYKDAPLIGNKRPDLSEVIPWIHFKAQNMMEPPWQTEIASIKQCKNIRYIAAMFVWF